MIHSSRLWQTVSSPALCTQIVTRNQWNTYTFWSINWGVLYLSRPLRVPWKTASIYLLLNSPTIIFLAHDHLPTCWHMGRIGKTKSNKCKCPACQRIKETAWHILSCPKWWLWQETLLSTTLSDTLQWCNHTQPNLLLMPLQGVRGPLTTPNFQMSTSNLEPSFQYLSIASQNQIGWSHLL